MGLCYGADDGSLTTTSVKIDVEYRVLPDGEWIRLQGVNMTELVLIEPRWSGGCWRGLDWFEIVAGSETPTDHIEGEVYIYDPDWWPNRV